MLAVTQKSKFHSPMPLQSSNAATIRMQPRYLCYAPDDAEFSQGSSQEYLSSHLEPLHLTHDTYEDHMYVSSEIFNLKAAYAI
ncbi:hypothetical protein RF55_12420 [Lasius niger]|uniref:Uncharacterized protein n=1 Tax=Lasius niger TaxID=67767 RepID=A0A0J7KD81_LASNI|nr:hypothetical protein RF55_12420 [Lasius niger]